MNKNVIIFSKNKLIYLLIGLLIIYNFFIFFYSNNYEIFATNLLQNSVVYSGQITHLYFNPLVAFPNIAFNEKNVLSSQFDKENITPKEFENILLSLYNNNYILIDITQTYEIKDNVVVKKDLIIPENKKPLILSFENVCYSSKTKQNGLINKIIVDRNNKLATYSSKRSVQDRISLDNDFIPILENFVSLHPDFSHQNAKGIICTTASDGILGYKIQKTNATYKYEIKKLTEVINRMKELGWKFASNGYSYLSMEQVGDIEFAKNINQWKSDITPLIKTDIFAYPYGEFDIYNEQNELSYKQQVLLDNGFNLFLGDNQNNFFDYINVDSKKILLMERKFVSGDTIRNFKESFTDLFDSSKIYDYENRLVAFPSNLLIE